MKKIINVVLIALALYSLPGHAKGKFESKDFHFLLEKAVEVGEKCGPSKTLIVLDIDNTLLTMNQDLGGDAWFNWQADLIAKSDLSDVVAPNIDGLLKIQGLLYTASSMHPVDAQNPSVIQDLQRNGFVVMALTSRGLDFQNVTGRELGLNKYDFTDTGPGPTSGYVGKFLPYDLNAIEASGLSKDEASRWKLGSAKPVVYQGGIFFGAGQHKGAMLKTLLAKTGFAPCGIVFIDDTPKHTERVWDAFDSTQIDINVIRYGYEDDHVNQFMASDKSEVKRQWSLLKYFLDSIH